MLCKEIMTSDVVSFRPLDRIDGAARRMRDENIGFAPVCEEDGKPVGAITDRDIALRVCAQDRRAGRTHVDDIMTRDLITCRMTDEVERAAHLMADHHRNRIIVLDRRGRLAGVISIADVIERGPESEALRTLRTILNRELRKTEPHDSPTAQGIGGGGRSPQSPSAEVSALAAILAARRSRRGFGRRPLTDTEIDALLWAGQGITSSEGCRAAPSAGALYPTTLTLVDQRGVWRYSPSDHGLALVRQGDVRATLAASALGQEAVAEAPATIVITADASILAGRYRARAERYCTLEAGHVAQNILLQAEALGLSAVPVGAFDDNAVLRSVELPFQHLALYLVPVGERRPVG